MNSRPTGPPFRLSLDYGGELKADAIVVAAGRIGNTEGLALENAGLATDPRGLLTVNEHFQTAQPHIRAAGDVIGFPALVIGCIDSRVPPELVFDQRIGDIFSARIAGNVAEDDVVGSVEFATKLAEAKLVVVLGHGECGAVKGAIDGAELGKLTQLLQRIKPAIVAVLRIESGNTRATIQRPA